jgi:3-isopropylmalate/(R)-2-methylmalate dehydratase small subunit
MPPWDKAGIIVTGPDFGTGSSREQAVWALVDFGIRCVIGPSFGEIFHANCFRNGVLPIILNGAPLMRVATEAEAGRIVTVDLTTATICLFDGTVLPFDVDSHRRRALIEGLDDIDVILKNDINDILTFENTERLRRPWLFLTEQQFSYFDNIKETSDD